MITGELKSQVDKVWEAFWTGGISNPYQWFWYEGISKVHLYGIISLLYKLIMSNSHFIVFGKDWDDVVLLHFSYTTAGSIGYDKLVFSFHKRSGNH